MGRGNIRLGKENQNEGKGEKNKKNTEGKMEKIA